MRGLGRMFVDMGDACLPLLMNEAQSIMLQILESLLMVADCPANVIAELSFSFWHRLIDALVDRLRHGTDYRGSGTALATQDLLSALRPYFTSLFDVLCRRLVLDDASDAPAYMDMKGDMWEDRDHVGDVIRDLAGVLGVPQCVDTVLNRMKSIEGPHQWPLMEGSYLALAYISDAIRPADLAHGNSAPGTAAAIELATLVPSVRSILLSFQCTSFSHRANGRLPNRRFNCRAWCLHAIDPRSLSFSLSTRMLPATSSVGHVRLYAHRTANARPCLHSESSSTAAACSTGHVRSVWEPIGICCCLCAAGRSAGICSLRANGAVRLPNAGLADGKPRDGA